MRERSGMSTIASGREIVDYKLTSGDLVSVRTAIIPGAQPIAPETPESLERVLAVVQSLTAELIETLGGATGAASGVQEVRVSVGLEIGAKGKLFICEGSTTAHLNVELTMKPAPAS
jgi:hypothetical protein